MLNYIWAALIICSLVFALSSDLSDLRHDPYRNNQPLPISLQFKSLPDPAARELPVDVVINPATYASFYNTTATPAPSYPGTLLQSDKGRQLRFAKDVPLPTPLAQIRESAQSDNTEVGELRGRLASLDPVNPATLTSSATVILDPVRFHKLSNVTKAALSMAKRAVNVALGLIGGLALWLGILRIAEASGLINVFVRLVRPILRPLFPSIPKDHPAFGMIALNLSAGMLGLGNAGTPMGIKAMEELQKLNKSPDTATNAMVMLMALNTTCVQLIPSPTLLALIGLTAGEVWLPTLLAGLAATIFAILLVKLFGRLGTFRRSDPDLLPTPTNH